MAFAKTTTEGVFLAIVSILQSDLSEGVENIYLSLNDIGEEPRDWVGDHVYRVKDTTGANVGEGEWVGGGENVTQMNSTFDVQIWTRLNQDQTGHDTERLTDSVYGLYTQMREVMKSLAGHDLQVSSSEVTWDCLTPQGYQSPYAIGRDKCVLVVNFSVRYDLIFT